MHFYTFRPPAPPVRTGTADAERWSRADLAWCAGVPLGIGSRFLLLGMVESTGDHLAARGTFCAIKGFCMARSPSSTCLPSCCLA